MDLPSAFLRHGFRFPIGRFGQVGDERSTSRQSGHTLINKPDPTIPDMVQVSSQTALSCDPSSSSSTPHTNRPEQKESYRAGKLRLISSLEAGFDVCKSAVFVLIGCSMIQLFGRGSVCNCCSFHARDTDPAPTVHSRQASRS